MTPIKILELFRDRTHDTAEPPLWSDAEIYGYADQAQTEFVRIIGGLRDSKTVAICDITVTAGINFVDISPKILKIVLAKSATLGKIPVINHTDYRAEALEAAGTLRYLVQGESENTLRPINVPTVNQAVHMTVMRLPLLPIADDTSAFEIRDEYTPYLLYGMYELAYLKDDPETYNKGRSEKHGVTFRAYANQAKVELERRNYTPGVIAYGGL